MRALYRRMITTTDTYTYTVNQGGELNIRSSNDGDRKVTIVFKDEKLVSVDHNLGDFCLRSNWYVYKGIAEEIERIEADYANSAADA